MNFITLAFLLFLAATCLVYYVLPRAARASWLLVCSYLFYLYDPTNADYILLLVGATLLTWGAGLAIERIRRPALRRGCVALSVCICMGVLVGYKYLTFFGNGLEWILGQVGVAWRAPSFHFVVPLGISYFTFAALGYVIDVYRGKPAEKDLLHYALFVSFFPCMITGPIERGHLMLPQIRNLLAFDYNRFTGGMFRVLWGFFKKLVISDTLGTIISTVYGNVRYEAYTGPVLLTVSLLFSYRLYCDFSACTDIAIGAGAMLGIDVMENFRRPLAATSFNDLWRRWHISLTSWFRDYVYIPLGGNRKGKVRQYCNVVLVFLVSGLWHGASFAFLVWGALNGIYLSVGKATQALREKLAGRNPLYFFAPVRKVLQCAITYLLFSSCLVFFLVGMYDSGSMADAGYVYAHFFTGWDALTEAQATLISLGFDATTTLVLVCSIVLVEVLECFSVPMQTLVRKIPWLLRWPLYYALCLGILFFGAFGQSSFIYQQY